MMSKYLIISLILSTLFYSFSCNSGSDKNGKVLSEAEKEKMYAEAEQRAIEKIEKNRPAQSSAEENIKIYGSWSKVNNLACTDSYPNTLSLNKDGTFSSMDGSAGKIKWSEGTYVLNSEDEISISAVGLEPSIHQYRFFSKMAMLTIHLSEECTLVYKKNL